MARKQVGELDEDLIARMDERALALGQSRVTFLTRAIEAAIGKPTGTETVAAVRRARGEGPRTSSQAKAGIKPIDRPSTTTQGDKGKRLKK